MNIITHGDVNIGIVSGSKNVMCHSERISGFKDCIENNYPHIKIVETVYNDDDDIKSYELTSQLLKNKDINLEERYLITGSKTDAGKDRLIPINYKILPLITKRMNINHEFLFYTRNNTPLIYNNFRVDFKEKLKELGIQEHTVHDTRHTFATLLSNLNANSTAIKNIIGHSDYKMTEKVYTHKDKEQLKKAIDLL